MSQNSSDVSKKPLIVLGVVVIVLILLCVVSFKRGIIGRAFKIEKAVVCVELDSDKRPRKIRDVMTYGTKQACLWFNYSSASEGNRLEVEWYYNDSLVLSDPVKLMTKDGVRAFYLLHEGGTPLPAGKYTVKIIAPTKELCSVNFKIVKK